MASNYFTISPTGGTGNGTIRVTPTGNNFTSVTREATLSINGQNVTIRQWGMPSLEGTTTISAPATGATYQIVVHSHYDVQFRNKPDWVTIDDGQGNYISSATTIQASVANGKTYNLTVAPNADNNNRSASFGMYHYMNGTLMSDYVSMGVSQPQGAEDHITIISTSALDWDDTNAKSISVNANVNWSASIDNTTDFELGGGQGYVTIRAKANNTGTTLKTTNISIVSNKSSFPYTATCVVTQFRQPTISIVDGGTVPPTGGSKTIRVASDYYWWIYPTVMPESPSANIPYITMTGKQAGQNMSPTTGETYTLTWNSNTGNIRNDNLYVGYLKTDNSTTGISTTYANYTQDNEASLTISVSPNRIPENVTDYVSSGGGTYQVVVTTGRPWQLNGTPSFCTVSPSTGTGTTTVTVTIPATDLNRVRSEQIHFTTNDAGTPAYDTVYVYQEAMYEEPKYIDVTPTGRTISSGGSPSLGNYFEVSANTNWYITYQPEWVIFRSQTIGGSLVTSGTSGVTNIYISCSPNSGSERSDVVWFAPPGASVATTSVTITQIEGAVTPSWIASPDTFDLPSGVSQTLTASITANTSWYVSKDGDDNGNWIIILQPTSTQTALTYNIMFYVTKNDTGSPRSGRIDVISADDDSWKLSILIDQE